MCVYVHACVYACVCMCACAACVRACVDACVRGCVRACLHTGTGGHPPRDSTVTRTEFLSLSVPLYVAMCVLAALGILLAAAFLTFNVMLRHVKYVTSVSSFASLLKANTPNTGVMICCATRNSTNFGIRFFVFDGGSLLLMNNIALSLCFFSKSFFDPLCGLFLLDTFLLFRLFRICLIVCLCICLFRWLLCLFRWFCGFCLF